MAVYNLPNYTNEQGFGLPLNIRRGNPNPLDNSSVWQSFAAAQNYAQTDPTAYVGQILSVVNYTAAVTDEEGNVTTPSQSTVEVYYIKDEAGNLEPVGTSPVGDEGTITVAEDGTVSLYGISGLELTREDENGDTVNITYQPLYVNGKLTWVEPSATTVEGLATEIEGLKSRISELETAVGGAEGGLVKDVADHGDAIDAINTKIGEVTEGKTVVEMISDAQTAATYDDTDVKSDIETLEGLVSEEATRAKGVESGLETRLKAVEDDHLTSADKTELSEAIEAAEESAVDRMLGYLSEEVVNEKYDTLKEVAAWIESDTTASAELITRVSNIEKDYLKGTDKTELQGEIDALGTYVGDLPEDAASETVVAYIQEVVDALQIGDYAKASELTGLAGRVATLEGYVGGKSVSEQIEAAIANKVDKVDGSRLMTDEEGTKLAGIAEGAQVNIIDTVDEAQFGLENKHLTLLDIAMGKVTGLSDALADKVDKVEGSRLLTEDEATKLEKLVLGENGEVSVSGKVAAGNVDGLEAWITARAGTLKGLSENNLSDTLLTKLEGIAEGAQVNVLEEIHINGTKLSITEKAVNIPIASETLLGVVKSSSDAVENSVAVDAEGAMTVNKLNVNKLVQTKGEELILDGGSAGAKSEE